MKTDTSIKLSKHSIRGVKGVVADEAYDECVRIYKSSPGSATLQIRHYGKCTKDNTRSKQKPDRFIFSAQMNREKLCELQKAISNLLDSEIWS